MYKLFSQRKREAVGDIPDIYEYNSFPEAFRNQFFHIVSDVLDKANNGTDYGYGRRINFWELTCDLYAREKGMKSISVEFGSENTSYAYESYVDTCNNEDFLDLLDFTVGYIFGHPLTKRYAGDDAVENAISELNYRFQQHSLGYEFISGALITKTDEHIHTNIVKPALVLLHKIEFRGSEDEFILAWKHYKDKNYKDAILNAGKAFESVMKTICKYMKYPFNEQSDDAKKLIQILRDNDFFLRILNRT